MRKSVLGLLFAGLTLVCAGVAFAATHVITVTPSNFNAIFNRTDVRPVSHYAFVNGPAVPPLGRGSLELTTVDSNGKQQHLETQQSGRPISAVNQMSYWTYRHAESTGVPVQVAAINMEVLGANTGVSGGYATFVYEPVYNAPPPVADNVWQRWDAYRSGTAIWWSTKDIPGPVPGTFLVCNPNGPNAGSPACANKLFVPWAVLVAANPGATILSYGVNQGSGNPGLISNVDALSIGVGDDHWVYDFEPCGKDKHHGNGHGHANGHHKGCKKPKHH
jgi:hypothetical protein